MTSKEYVNILLEGDYKPSKEESKVLPEKENKDEDSGNED